MLWNEKELSVKECQVGAYCFYVDTFKKGINGFLESVAALADRKGGKRCVAIINDVERIAEYEPVEVAEFENEELAQRSEVDQWMLMSDEDVDYLTYGLQLASGGVDALCCYGNRAREAGLAASREGVDVSFCDEALGLAEWLEALSPDDVILIGDGSNEGSLIATIDAIHGSSFLRNLYHLRNSTLSLHAKFLMVGGKLEFYRNEECGWNRVTVPDSIAGVPVTRISANAFNRCRNLREVILPDSVTNIGSSAFYICPRLTMVKLPSSLKVIEDSAFNYCTSLECVEIPDGVTHIGRRAFFDCLRLEEVVIPASVEFIGEEAFRRCEALRATVVQGSYAERYCLENEIDYRTV